METFVKNIWKLIAAFAIIGGLVACKKDNGPERPEGPGSYFAWGETKIWHDQVLPKRWIVERLFALLENFSCLTIDYEFLADTAEAMVQLAFTQIMLNKFFQ